AATSGRAYMLARLAEERRRRAAGERAGRVADAIHAPLASLARDSTSRILAAAELPLSGAYLVSRGQVDAFRREVGRIADAPPELRVLCTGPWPPYHFAPAIRASDPVELIRV